MKDSIKSKIINYNKESLLEWMSATSMSPDNEFYQFRFMFLKQFILSIDDSEFRNNSKIESGLIGYILEDTNLTNWSSIEDWSPIKNSKSNIFGLNGDSFYFLSGNLETPEKSLEIIVTRFFEFEDRIICKYKYSIKKQFMKLLQYQTNIINFIEKNKNSNFQNYKAFKIPNEQFVADWTKILNEHFSFSENLWNNISDIPEPKSINESEQFFKINPIINNKIYSPYILLLSFINKITNDIKNIFDNEIRQLLHKQLKREVLTSILEVVPREAIFYDLKIGKINERFEFGFIFDNNLFFFKLIEETWHNPKIQ